MAKKKTIKKEKKVITNPKDPVTMGTIYVPDADAIMECMTQIAKINERIDRIVNAHERCRSLKGL